MQASWNTLCCIPAHVSRTRIAFFELTCQSHAVSNLSHSVLFGTSSVADSVCRQADSGRGCTEIWRDECRSPAFRKANLHVSRTMKCGELNCSLSHCYHGLTHTSAVSWSKTNLLLRFGDFSLWVTAFKVDFNDRQTSRSLQETFRIVTSAYTCRKSKFLLVNLFISFIHSFPFIY